MNIEREDLQKLFDIATGSMNFSSGFLDDDEVQTLRRVAVVLGVDPMEGTPYDFRKRYQHDFVAYERTAEWSVIGPDRCKWCSGLPEEHDRWMAAIR